MVSLKLNIKILGPIILFSKLNNCLESESKYKSITQQKYLKITDKFFHKIKKIKSFLYTSLSLNIF